MENDSVTEAGSAGEKPQKSTAPITIDIESDDDVVQKDQKKQTDVKLGEIMEAKETDEKSEEKDKKVPLVIPVDEDEEDSVSAKQKDTVEELKSPEKKEDEIMPPRKKKMPEVISVDEDDDEKLLEKGVPTTEETKEAEPTESEEKTADKISEIISIDESEDGETTAKGVEKDEKADDDQDVKTDDQAKVNGKPSEDLIDDAQKTAEDKTGNGAETLEKDEVLSSIDKSDKEKQTEKEHDDIILIDDEKDSAQAPDSKAGDSKPDHEKIEIANEPIKKQRSSTDSPETDKSSQGAATVPPEAEKTSQEADKTSLASLETKSNNIDMKVNEAASTEKSPSESSEIIHQGKDEDVIMVEDDVKVAAIELKSNEAESTEKLPDESPETIHKDKDEDVMMIEDDASAESNAKQADKKAEDASGSTEHSSDKPNEAKEKVKENGDVMMLEDDSKLEATPKPSKKEAAKASDANENDDIMVIDSDSNLADVAESTSITETKSANEKSESKEPESMVIDLEKVEDVTKKDAEETNGDTKSEANADTKSSESASEAAAGKKTTEADNESSKEKTLVLDEKSGMFKEKDANSEEKIPQLITGDSDEDVVMIEDDDPPPAKKTTTPKKVVPLMKMDIGGASPKVVPPEKEEPPKEAKPKPQPKLANVDCINPECKKESKETTPAQSFVLNFFGIPKKTKKQRVCAACYNDVVEKYSEMCGTIVNQQPLLFCEMPRKNELVEISDSSEEEEDEDTKLETAKPLPSDVIALVESDLNDILTSTFEKINLNQQIDWTEQIMRQKIAYNSKLSDEINNELNELQRKVDRIHLKLYSKSRPRYQHLPPCNIFHEVDLLSKNQSTTVHQSIQQQAQGNRQYSPQRPYTQSAQQKLPVQSSPTGQSAALPTGLPKKDEFVRPAVVVGQFYFAVKHKLLSNWAECQVVEAVNVSDKALYKVNFMFNHASAIKVVPAKYLAYRHSFNVKLPLGTRVIARFDAGTTQPAAKTQQQNKTTCFYPGIIAESFGKYNRHRYLIFFDDGYAQYVSHGDVRVVCEESKDVWTDIHPHSQEFIKNYLMNYRSQRPMVQVKVGQRLITEWKGKWIYAKVVDLDASLVQLHFPDDNRYEWIYRGSTRLGPLYQEKALSMNKMSINKFSKFQKRNEPSIEYITIDDDEDDQNKQEGKKPSPQEQALQNYNLQSKQLQQDQALADAASIRSVAKKSTFHRSVPTSQPSAVFMNSSTIYCEDDRPKGKIVYYTAKKHLPPLKYKPHDCYPNCLFKITHNLKSYSPLAKPLLSGWERQLCKMKYKKVFVVYRAPCGRRLRNMYELHKYLRMTKATLNVENFDFDPMVHCLAEYVIENHIYHNPDLSDGREFMAVPCVNYFDDTKPPPCIYSTERLPTDGVKLNLDADFLCGCDCEDDCLDKTRCQCWQLTIAGAKFGNPSTSVDNIGYVYKRLQEAVVTGIYECNARCKCNNSCLNRVVQHPLQTKLQVFKTSNRGWGIRCLNDVSKGSFICIYSGHLLTEEAGNMICQMNENKAGDEYFADLDYIETVEQLKEGYETDVVESESENESDEEEPEYDAKRDTDASDDDFTSNCNPSDAVVKTRSQVRRDSTKKTEPKIDKASTKPNKKKEDSKNGSDDEREMVNLEPDSDMTKGDATSPSIKYRSVRKMYGKHEQMYIMDAKKSGNLGRYFNHSCNPNLFVQNVFVDTHDLRFPWVAFFALCNIRAGSELTWNYNYDVGSVPGKVLYCQCGAENCRQRLL